MLLSAGASAVAVLASCGGGDVVSQLTPGRIVVFGDGFSDLGQRGSRFTVNDGGVNIWTQQVASRYGVPLTNSADGGLSLATGQARVSAKPDAAGNAATPTVKEQIDAFLATQAPRPNDMVIVSAGISDVVAEVARQRAGAQTQAQTLANLGQAGGELGAQVRRLVQAGAQYVTVVGTYNLGRSPWALSTKQEPLLLDASRRFNEDMLVSMVDLGANVLYVDAALFFNLVTSSPPSYKFTNATEPLCTSIDPGPGIGIGAGQVNSALCTPANLPPGRDPLAYVFADPIYLTPFAHRSFGDYAFDRIRQRW
jgi:phospholipase/lecithinase/hemolysin